METLEKLSEKERIYIREKTIDNLYDRMWCRLNEIDYVDPNFREALTQTCKEMYGEKDE